MLKQVIIKLPNDVQEHLLVEMEFMMAYIKYGFDYRLGDQDTGTCLLHQVEYGLTPATSSPAQAPTAFCSNFKKVCYFYHHLKVYLEHNSFHSSSIAVVDGCSAKARLFFGHRLRVINQQREIKAMIHDM
jgi:hypothetical protein